MGTWSTVYRAKDRETKQVFALKKLKFDFDEEGFPMEALREMNILLAMTHPHVVKVREVVTTPTLDSWFMVMELMDCDLGTLIEPANTPFTPAQVKGLMIQLCSALAAMHECWILHRDLKMPNLLISHDGVLKVCDFGLARRFGDPVKKMTPKVITLWYRCPELLLGPKSVFMYSCAVDMWSAGCLFAEMLSRDVLFYCQTEVQLLDQSFQLIGPPVKEDGRCFDLLAKRTVKLPTVPHQPGALRRKFPRQGYEPHFIHKDQFKTTALSDTGFELLESCLCLNENKRISAADALAHPWFQEAPLPEFFTAEQIGDLKKSVGTAREAKERSNQVQAQVTATNQVQCCIRARYIVSSW